MRILLVEDDELLAESLVKVLGDNHYAVDLATDGQTGWEMANAAPYDLLLLDVGLPLLDGISICRQLRAQSSHVPVLLLTAHDTETQKIIGLDAGADDYVIKPFHLPELLARIRALLRRGSTSSAPLLVWDGLRLNPSTCEVTYDSRILNLTPKEYSLLELLLRNGQRVFSPGAIIDHLWSFEEPPSEETVRSHVKGLRQKLKAAGLPSDPIETVYGIGYRLKPEEEQMPQESVQTPEKRSSKGGWKHGTPDQNRESRVLSLPRSPLPRNPEADQRTLEVMTQAWERVRQKCLERIAAIERAVAPLEEITTDAAHSGELRQQAIQEAHKLAGSMGMFGVSEGSEIARQIETLLQSPTADAHQPQFQQLTQTLRDSLEHATAAGLPPLMLSDSRSWAAVQSMPRSQPNEARILAVDDDPDCLAALQQLITPWGMQLIGLESPQQFWTTLKSTTPDLLILDVELPHLSGIDLCRAIRNDDEWSGLPILFLTAHTDAATLQRVYEVGADDFVAKPIMPPELLTRILNRLERSRLLRHRADQDSLTGLANRHRFSRDLTPRLASAHPHRPLLLALFHLEGLQTINHTYGYSAGDRLLVQFGDRLQQAVASAGMVAHWGGALFAAAVDLPSAETATWLPTLERVLTNQTFTLSDGTPIPVQFTTGLATTPHDGVDLPSLYLAAEANLWQASPQPSDKASQSHRPSKRSFSPKRTR